MGWLARYIRASGVDRSRACVRAGALASSDTFFLSCSPDANDEASSRRPGPARSALLDVDHLHVVHIHLPLSWSQRKPPLDILLGGRAGGRVNYLLYNKASRASRRHGRVRYILRRHIFDARS